MRTGRSLTVWRSLLPGGCLLPGGVSAPGGCLTPIWEQTGACENITFPLPLRAVVMLKNVE